LVETSWSARTSDTAVDETAAGANPVQAIAARYPGAGAVWPPQSKLVGQRASAFGVEPCRHRFPPASTSAGLLVDVLAEAVVDELAGPVEVLACTAGRVIVRPSAPDEVR